MQANAPASEQPMDLHWGISMRKESVIFFLCYSDIFWPFHFESAALQNMISIVKDANH